MLVTDNTPAEQVESTEQETQQDDSPVNPLLLDEEAEEAEYNEPPTEEPVQEDEPETNTEPEPEPEPEQPAADPVITALQEQLAQQSHVMQQMMQQIQQLANPQAKPEPEPEPEPAGAEAPNYDELMEAVRFGEPAEAQAAMNKLIAHQVQQALELSQKQQAKQQQEFQARQDTFNQELKKLPDLEAILPEMELVIKERPHLINAMEPKEAVSALAEMARGRVSAKAADEAKKVDWRKQALSDPEIRKQIIQEHTDSLRRGKPAPKVISSQPGGGTPAAPASRPKSIREAGDLFEAHMQG